MAHKLAIFDIDGTIAVKGKVPQNVIEGLKHIQTLGYLTTVSTGRAYSRMRAALGSDFEDVISPEALIILEHGTKIVHRDGSVVQADYFGPAEKEHFVDFIRSNEDMVKLCRWAVSEPDAPIQIWVKDPADLEAAREKFSGYSAIFTCPYDELKERVLGAEISHFLARLQDFIIVDNLKLKFTRSNMDVMFLDNHMQFVGNLSDKAKAIQYLEQFHEVPIAHMLIAGNGINDVDMLNLDAGQRILVGTGAETEGLIGHIDRHDSIIRVESPAALGGYLQRLS